MTDAVILPDNLDEMIEESGKPALPEGRYLAIIMGGAAKTSENGKLSYGITWQLLVNNNPDSVQDGWDTEAATTALNYVYTFIGTWTDATKTRFVSGKKPSFVFTHMMDYLGVSGKAMNPADHKFRQIVVKIKHEPDQRDPDILRLVVGDVYKYIVGEETCPVLANLAEAYEEMRSETAKELDDVFGEGSGEALADSQPQVEAAATGKKPRGKKKDEAGDEAW